MTCRLSIITPVFNGARFMESCIKNVIDQQCTEAEHIIIDGGSTDATAVIIRRYAAEHPHIRWISEPDRGQSDAMNKGIVMASGSIVGFLNVDDFYEPGAVNEALELFSDLPEPSLLVGNCNVWEGGDILQGVGKPYGIGLLNLLCARVAISFPLNPSSYFYHRSAHDRIGLYDVEEHYGMDVHFIIKAVQACNIKYVDRLWGNLRYLPGTKTYQDVKSGQNRIRVGSIIAFYRRQAPLHFRIFSMVYVNLVKMYKLCLRMMGRGK